MSRPAVYVTRRLPQAAIDLLTPACDVRVWESETAPVPRDVLLREAATADGILSLLTDRVDTELLAAAPQLRIVANMAVGYDNVELAALNTRGVLLTNTPDVLTETTADLAWSLVMATNRRLIEGQKVIEAGRWGAWSPMFLVGQDVYGAALGVVGAGRIGSAVLRRAAGFNMRLLYHNRRPSAELEAETGARYMALDDLLREADIVVVLVPLTQETRGMFGEREFALMKETATFINVARGPIVKELELVEALRRGRPWAAGLDVFEREPIGADHPLLALPNVVAVPHIGSASVATRTRMATTAARNLAEFLSGRAAPNPVNPEVLTK